jgi:hypothetical protein
MKNSFSQVAVTSAAAAAEANNNNNSKREVAFLPISFRSFFPPFLFHFLCVVHVRPHTNFASLKRVARSVISL